MAILVSCVSGAFPLYHVSFFWFCCHFYQPRNQIFSIMSLTMMGLAPGPLVHALFLFALNNLLVVLTNPLVVSTTPLVVFVVRGVWNICSNMN